MKKVWALLLTLAMGVGLTACGSGQEGRDPKDVTITVWASGAGAQVDAMKAACEAFAAETG